MYYCVLSMYYHVLSFFRIIRGNTLYYHVLSVYYYMIQVYYVNRPSPPVIHVLCENYHCFFDVLSTILLIQQILR